MSTTSACRNAVEPRFMGIVFTFAMPRGYKGVYRLSILFYCFRIAPARQKSASRAPIPRDRVPFGSSLRRPTRPWRRIPSSINRIPLRASVPPCLPPHSSHLLNLPILQLQRRRPTEDRGDDANRPLVRDDLVHVPLEIHERPVGHLHPVPLLEVRPAGGRPF